MTENVDSFNVETVERSAYPETREVEVDDRSEREQELRHGAQAVNSNRIQGHESAAASSEQRSGPATAGAVNGVTAKQAIETVEPNIQSPLRPNADTSASASSSPRRR